MSNIKLFESRNIRSVWDEESQRWLFAVVDVVAALTDSQNPQVYWRVLKKRLLAEGNESVTNCNALKMTASDGTQRLTDVAHTEQLFRLVQSIPSPKAEPFKRWLAKVGYERLEEIENPELAAARMRELYKAKGYSDEWIEKRVRGIAVRDELTNEWKKRGVKEQREYSILTAEISRATFGMTPTEYKAFKSLDKPAARPHERSGTDFHHAGRSLYHRDCAQQRCAGLYRKPRCDLERRSSSWAGAARSGEKIRQAHCQPRKL